MPTAGIADDNAIEIAPLICIHHVARMNILPDKNPVINGKTWIEAGPATVRETMIGVCSENIDGWLGFRAEGFTANDVGAIATFERPKDRANRCLAEPVRPVDKCMLRESGVACSRGILEATDILDRNDFHYCHSKFYPSMSIGKPFGTYCSFRPMLARSCRRSILSILLCKFSLKPGRSCDYRLTASKTAH